MNNFEEIVSLVHKDIQESGSGYLDWGRINDAYKNCPDMRTAVDVATMFQRNGYFCYYQTMGFGNPNIPLNTFIAIRIFTNPQCDNSRYLPLIN